MTTKAQATIEDLYRVPENGKAEIVNGELILVPPTGARGQNNRGRERVAEDWPKMKMDFSHGA